MKTSARLRIWPVPIAIGAATAVGLVAALVSDGAGDAVSWFGLGLPIVVIARYVWWPPGRRR